MKALLSVRVGGPETLVLRDIADPVPGAGEVLIAVKACGLNYPDQLIIQDKYQFKPTRPFSPGGEVAGVVEALGDGVSDFCVGDRVIGSVTWGGLAQKLALPATGCVKIPSSMPFDEAAAFLLSYVTSYHALKHRAAIAPGETLLVLGAGGGVGLAAVELGRAFGARVIGAASSSEKLKIAEEAGAHKVLMYPRDAAAPDIRRQIASDFKSAAEPSGIDVVYDCVGGSYTESALRALNIEGRLLIVGFPAGIASIPMNLPLLKACQIVGVFAGDWMHRKQDQYRAAVKDLITMYRNGQIRPRISARFPLSDAPRGLMSLVERTALGKLVVLMDDQPG